MKAVRDGDTTALAIVQWIHENRKEGCTTRAMDAVASLEIVEWLHINRTEGCTYKAMDSAVQKGDFEVTLLLHEHRNEAVAALQAAHYAHQGSGGSWKRLRPCDQRGLRSLLWR